jgi:hypothetical protein
MREEILWRVSHITAQEAAALHPRDEGGDAMDWALLASLLVLMLAVPGPEARRRPRPT